MDRDDIIKASNEARDKPRWTATVFYHTAENQSSLGVPHDIMELGELEEIVERGPDFRSIDFIQITYNRQEGEPTTVIPLGA
jgi:hypothetical protein